MPLNTPRARELLAQGDFETLFIEELGWDRHSARLEVSLSAQSFTLVALAQKRGMVAWHCPTPSSSILPIYSHRRQVERQVAKSALEHLVVFTDPSDETQIWQWVKREPGRPTACREHTYHRSQPGDALIQKLEAIAFSLDEEETLSLTDVVRRARAGFDVERLTRRFYDRFQAEHRAFVKFVNGITDKADQEWYASVMLNRLMFVYFIQRKGFLDGDRNYLRSRLSRMQAERGRDKFYSFYRYFLLRLFHEGLGGKARSSELEDLLGRIPYLNGGLFDVHELERPDRYGETIKISDEAFEHIFDYFDQYHWHLDERPLRADNEINPDVLGYIFEKYVNQKQMGAYYTKEDITEYISKSTLLPFLLKAAQAKCEVAFNNPGGPTIWDQLGSDADRYVYSTIRHGAEHPLPPTIAAGLSPPSLHDTVGDKEVLTVSLRKNWDEPAPPQYALPMESWREVLLRRRRHDDLLEKLCSGEVCSVHDLTVLNLDIRQFAQDVIENCEGPELLRAFWNAIREVAILDPTCGSGAFLFAALNVLDPLYEACLNRMEVFIEDLDRSSHGHPPDQFSDFREVLDRVATHPNRRYFILKSIILNNLFGVDIMEEAVEICKLRLFLMLAAQIEPQVGSPNLGVEPLPDIDFNIRPGNALVGYATHAEVRDAVGGKLDFDDTTKEITSKALSLHEAFEGFRARQIELDGMVSLQDKEVLGERLKALDDELSRYLARDFGVKSSSSRAYSKWLLSHQPLHWFVEFHGVMQRGGFDVIIGNPPWRQYSSVRREYAARGYSVEQSGNLHAFCTERSMKLLAPGGYFSFIVQLPAVSSSRMSSVRQLLLKNSSHLCSIPCDDRPGKLFEGLQHCRSVILVARKDVLQEESEYFTTRYNRWHSVARDHLFESLGFSQVSDERLLQAQLPKVDGLTHARILEKLWTHSGHPTQQVRAPGRTDYFIFYQEATQYWVKAVCGLPFYAKNGQVGPPAHGRFLYFPKEGTTLAVSAVLNSSLFYLYFITYSDCFHLSDTLVGGFPLSASVLADRSLVALAKRLMNHLHEHSEKQTISTRDGDEISYEEFDVSQSKAILDDIDWLLAKHYGFSEEELDFVLSYDIKYRLGADGSRESDA